MQSIGCIIGLFCPVGARRDMSDARHAKALARRTDGKEIETQPACSLRPWKPKETGTEASPVKDADDCEEHGQDEREHRHGLDQL